jgi:hypothetical protein
MKDFYILIIKNLVNVNKMKVVFILNLFLSITLTAFSQSAIDGFLKGKNTLDIAISGSYQTADDYFGNAGKFKYNRDLYIFNAFAEYGITDKLDVIATLPFIGDKLQDGGLYAKYKVTDFSFAKQKLSIIPALGLTAPLSNYKTQSGAAIGQRATQFHGHLVLQTTLPAGFYWQVQGAYHYALNPVPSSYTFSSKLMYTYKKLYLDFWYEYQKGLGTNTYPTSGVDFRTLTVDYEKIGGVIFYNLAKNWGVFVNGSYIMDGLDTFQSTTISVGFTKKIVFNSKLEQSKE